MGLSGWMENQGRTFGLTSPIATKNGSRLNMLNWRLVCKGLQLTRIAMIIAINAHSLESHSVFDESRTTAGVFENIAKSMGDCPSKPRRAMQLFKADPIHEVG